MEWWRTLKISALMCVFIFLLSSVAFCEPNNTAEGDKEIKLEIINNDLQITYNKIKKRFLSELSVFYPKYGDIQYFSSIISYYPIYAKIQDNNLIVNFHYKVKAEPIELPETEKYICEGNILKYYYGNENIINDIPENVTEIGESCFANAENLQEIIIPNNIKKINASAFISCSNLKSIIIPDSVEYIGENAFYQCGLEQVTLSKNLKTLGNFSFSSCNLKEITIPGSVNSIGKQAFENNNNLKKIIIEKGVKRIEAQAFSSNGNNVLSGITIPSGIDIIGNHAFKNYYKLRTIHFEDNSDTKTILGSSAFSCDKVNTEMKNLIIPKNIQVISSGCFYNHPNLAFIQIDNGVEAIGDEAFSNDVNINDYFYYYLDNKKDNFNDKLTRISIPGSVKKIGKLAFGFYLAVENIYLEEGIEYIDDGAFGTTENKVLEKLCIPKSVKKVGKYAFMGYKNLKEVELTNTIKKDKHYIFKKSNDNIYYKELQ